MHRAMRLAVKVLATVAVLALALAAVVALLVTMPHPPAPLGVAILAGAVALAAWVGGTR